jgi:hypothetical protein
MIRRREDITEIFSSFLDVSTERWIDDPTLKRNMLRMTKIHDYSIEQWARYWLNILSQPAAKPDDKILARYHLMAYLEEPCYFAANKTSEIFSQIDDWRDCFHETRIKAIELFDRLAHRYDVSKGASFSTYFQASLKLRMLDKYSGGSVRSEAGTLRHISERRLRHVLKGLPKPEEIESHILAWHCFREVYVPTTPQGLRRIPMPNKEQYQAIAQRYNQLSVNSGLAGGISGEKIEAFLKTCIEKARASENIEVDPLDTKVFNLDFSDSDAKMAEGSKNAEQEQLEQEQLAENHLAVATLMEKAFLELSIKARTSLMLCHGLEINFDEVGKQLFEVTQGTCSRKVQNWEKPILKSLLQWSADPENLGKAIKPEDIDKIAKQVRVLLTSYLREPFYQCLTEQVQRLSQVDPDLMHLTYIQSVHILAMRSQVSQTNSLARIQSQLVDNLQTHIETTWKINLKVYKSANKKLSKLVKDWLEAEMYKTIR